MNGRGSKSEAVMPPQNASKRGSVCSAMLFARRWRHAAAFLLQKRRSPRSVSPAAVAARQCQVPPCTSVALPCCRRRPRRHATMPPPLFASHRRLPPDAAGREGRQAVRKAGGRRAGRQPIQEAGSRTTNQNRREAGGAVSIGECRAGEGECCSAARERRST